MRDRSPCYQQRLPQLPVRSSSGARVWPLREAQLRLCPLSHDHDIKHNVVFWFSVSGPSRKTAHVLPDMACRLASHSALDEVWLRLFIEPPRMFRLKRYGQVFVLRRHEGKTLWAHI
nr:hypothetical protein CFP56_52741 [Quercus suber]